MSDDAAGFTRWKAPPVDDPAQAALRSESGNARLLTASRLETLRQQAHEEAFALGLKEGRIAGREETAERIAVLDTLLSGLAEPFKELDGEVETELVNLAINVARQIIRRELKTDPSHIVGVVREAVKVLPVAARNVRVHLHPEDAAVVRRALTQSVDELPWEVVEDPLLTRGGARVSTETAQIDARVESRLGAILIALVEGDRDDDERNR